MFARRFWTRLGLLLILSLPVGIANAADDDDDRAPWYDVPAIPHRTNWVPWVVASAFIVGCVGVAMKNPHRSHLD
ncbi:MAG: hypothetical protein GX547_01080 [Phycisphaerae bacterium]|nr:hypothetical protein [Phycisphaerae bacterium]